MYTVFKSATIAKCTSVDKESEAAIHAGGYYISSSRSLSKIGHTQSFTELTYRPEHCTIIQESSGQDKNKCSW